MGAENDSHSDHLDRLFEHRNKEYGAYALRKAYNRQLIKGSVGMCLVVVLCIGGYYWWGGRERLAKEPPILYIPFCSLETATMATPSGWVPQQLKIKPVTPLYMVPFIVSDTSVEEQDLEDVRIASTICEGITDNLFLTDLPPPEEFGTDAASSTDSVEPDLYFGSCDETMPQYPGGREAMFRFINKNLRLPDSLPGITDSLREADTPQSSVCTTIFVQFRVDADGQISDIRFPRLAFEPYQTEVRRVFEAMPKWIPGTRDKKPVPMYSTLPVMILLTEE